MDKLDGYWLMIPEWNSLTATKFIEIKNNEISHFTIKEKDNNGVLELSKYETSNIKDKNYELYEEYECTLLFFYSMVQNHTLFTENFKVKNAVDNNKLLEKDSYIKLEPTKNYLLNRIEKSKYSLRWNDFEIPILFNETVNLSRLLSNWFHNNPIEIILERFANTYFVSFYSDTTRLRLFPIRYVDSEKILLSGFPEEPYIVQGDKLK